VWAELLVHFQRGEQWHLTPEENDALGKLNKEHEAVDPVEEMILAAFDWDKPALHGFEMTASEVLMAIGYDKPNKGQATHASKVLKKLTGKDPKPKAKGRYFMLPSQPKRNRQAMQAALPIQDDPDRPF
jgi:putative DNA primase/helicase